MSHRQPHYKRVALHSNRTWRRNPAKSKRLLDSTHGHTLAVYLATEKMISCYTNLVDSHGFVIDVDMTGQLDWGRRALGATNFVSAPWWLGVGRLGDFCFRVRRQTQEDVWGSCVISFFFQFPVTSLQHMLLKRIGILDFFPHCVKWFWKCFINGFNCSFEPHSVNLHGENYRVGYYRTLIGSSSQSPTWWRREPRWWKVKDNPLATYLNRKETSMDFPYHQRIKLDTQMYGNFKM